MLRQYETQDKVMVSNGKIEFLIDCHSGLKLDNIRYKKTENEALPWLSNPVDFLCLVY